MLRRFTALTICISLVGMTMTPASLLPCCCKKRQPMSANAMAHSCCQPQQAPACRMHESMASSEHCSGLLMTVCKKCRCLEQMQVIALTAYVAQPEPLRIVAALLETDPLQNKVPCPISAGDRPIRPQKISPDLTLLKCSYLC
jgi:hypothetical protein